jgi:DNA gyrase subunit A
MQDISKLGRITSGVKMMNLKDGVKIAQIAKVREKISDGNQEFDNIEDAEASVEAEYAESEQGAERSFLEDVEDDPDKEINLPKEEEDE